MECGVHLCRRKRLVTFVGLNIAWCGRRRMPNSFFCLPCGHCTWCTLLKNLRRWQWCVTWKVPPTSTNSHFSWQAWAVLWKHIIPLEGPCAWWCEFVQGPFAEILAQVSSQKDPASYLSGPLAQKLVRSLQGSFVQRSWEVLSWIIVQKSVNCSKGYLYGDTWQRSCEFFSNILVWKTDEATSSLQDVFQRKIHSHHVFFISP